MKSIYFFILLLTASMLSAQDAMPIDLSHWQLELPTGYKAAEWKLMNIQNDTFAKPFFRFDEEGALVMEAYPAPGTSKATYTRNQLRERIVPCDKNINWTMEQGGMLTAEFEVSEVSKETDKKYHRILLFQVHGTTSDAQEEEMGLRKAVSVPMLSVYWQNERIRVVRKILEDPSARGNDLINKKAWKNGPGRYFPQKVGFGKVKMSISVKEGLVEITMNGKKISYKDSIIRRWPFENYFNAGNYLQAKGYGAKSIVKFYQLEVTH